MNDNRKSTLEQALDAVRSSHEADDLSDGELRELLDDFKAKLAEKDALDATRPH